MFSHNHKVRVRYAETDQMGVVHHSRYALYLEEARTECMRQMGIPYADLEERGIMLPLIKMENNFINSAKYDEVLTIKTIVKTLPLVKFHIDYEVYNEQEQLINSSNTTLVFVNKETRKAMRCPQDILAILESHFQ